MLILSPICAGFAASRAAAACPYRDEPFAHPVAGTETGKILGKGFARHVLANAQYQASKTWLVQDLA
jgi:hypothetical protein